MKVFDSFLGTQIKSWLKCSEKGLVYTHRSESTLTLIYQILVVITQHNTTKIKVKGRSLTAYYTNIICIECVKSYIITFPLYLVVLLSCYKRTNVHTLKFSPALITVRYVQCPSKKLFLPSWTVERVGILCTYKTHMLKWYKKKIPDTFILLLFSSHILLMPCDT